MMRDKKKIKEIETLLMNERYLDAGKKLREYLPIEDLPILATSLLMKCAKLVDTPNEIDELLRLCKEERWSLAKKQFSNIRKITLTIEDSESEYNEAILLLGENVAKVLYNATLPKDPFDQDSFDWMIRCAFESIEENEKIRRKELINEIISNVVDDTSKDD